MPTAILSATATGAVGVDATAAAAEPDVHGRLRELESLLDHLSGFAYRSRRAGSTWFLEYVSDGVLAVTGYTAADLIKTRTQSTATIMDPQDQAWFWPALQAALEAGQHYAFEYRIRTASGTTCWLLDKGKGLYADGELVGAAGFATDITDRKQMEDALRASRDELAALFESSSDAIVLADAETGVILDVNPAAVHLLALPKERLIGAPVTELHPPELAGRVRALFRAHVDGASPVTDLDVLTGDGRRVPVRVVGGASAFRHGRRVMQVSLRDLTRRRLAEQEAADLRQMIEVVLAGGKANVTIVTTDLTVRYVDPVWRAAHGDPGGRTWREYFSWRAAFGAEEQIREAFAAKRRQVHDHALPDPDGRIIEVTTVPFHSATGEWLVAEFESDATEARRADEAVRRSEARYRRLFELESDAIVLMETPVCRILDVNQATVRLFGYSRAELLTMRSHDLSAEVEASESTIRNHATQVPLRYTRRKDGTILPVEVTLSYFEDWGRTLCLAAIRDITARLETERILRESARRMDSLLNNLPGFAFRCRNDAACTMDYISDGVEALTGYPPGDFLDARVRTFLSIMNPADIEKVVAETSKAFAARQSYVVEYRIQTAAGEERWLWEKGRGVYDGETLAAAEGFATDITERRHAEAAQQALQAKLLQGQKMEVVGRLAGGVAHDFNNLLTVILGCASMVMEETLEPQTLADVRQIHKAGERARSLTRQLLAFGRKQVLDLRRIDLNRVVLDHVDMLKRLIGEDISVQTVLQPDPWEVSGDTAQMVQVLMNLAVNARDAMPTGGTLILRTTNVEAPTSAVAAVPELRPGPHVLLEVTDTGCGMDSETQKHLFEPFFTTKPVGEGSGLGLATIYGIIEQHGGHIACASSLGQGTTFRVYLPRLTEASAASSVSRPEQQPAGGSETVLLVEDDPAVLRMAATFMTRYGYQVVSATSPAEALRLAASMEALDLLLSDVIMPGMNGRELYAEVVALKPDTKVLYMSGYPGEVLSDRGHLGDGIRLLQKPFTAAALATRVRETLDAGK